MEPLARTNETTAGRLTARVHTQRRPPHRVVVWSVDCPSCGRTFDLTTRELDGDLPPQCITPGCRTPDQGYGEALELTLANDRPKTRARTAA